MTPLLLCHSKTVDLKILDFFNQLSSDKVKALTCVLEQVILTCSVTFTPRQIPVKALKFSPDHKRIKQKLPRTTKELMFTLASSKIRLFSRKGNLTRRKYNFF